MHLAHRNIQINVHIRITWFCTLYRMRSEHLHLPSRAFSIFPNLAWSPPSIFLPTLDNSQDPVHFQRFPPSATLPRSFHCWVTRAHHSSRSKLCLPFKTQLRSVLANNFSHPFFPHQNAFPSPRKRWYL